jgi:hypothetical protein
VVQAQITKAQKMPIPEVLAGEEHIKQVLLVVLVLPEQEILRQLVLHKEQPGAAEVMLNRGEVVAAEVQVKLGLLAEITLLAEMAEMEQQIQ